MDQIRSSIVWDISMQADGTQSAKCIKVTFTQFIVITGCEEIKIRDGFTENNYKN